MTDVSHNFEMAKKIPAFTPKPPEKDGTWRMQQEAHRAHPGIPEVHRVLPLPGRLSRHPRPRQEGLVRRAALHDRARRPRHAPARHARSARAHEERVRCRPLQHHPLLHGGVPGEHRHHRQRHHPAGEERVADDYYDPIRMLLRKVAGGPKRRWRACHESLRPRWPRRPPRRRATRPGQTKLGERCSSSSASRRRTSRPRSRRRRRTAISTSPKRPRASAATSSTSTRRTRRRCASSASRSPTSSTA